VRKRRGLFLFVGRSSAMSTTDSNTLQSLLGAAREANKSGRSAEAADLWQRVVDIAPDNPEALLALGIAALAKGDAAGALQWFGKAAAANPKDPMVQLYIALASKETGDTDAEMAAVTQALTIDPYFYPAVLHRAMLFERLGKRRQAAQTFGKVLLLIPPAEQLSPGMQRALAHARASIAENQRSLEQHLAQALSALRQRHVDERLERFDRGVDVLLGKRKIFHPQPVMLHYPDLAPIQFFDREAFPWLATLEAHADAMRDELLGVLAASAGEFQPLVDYPADAPVGPWAELNRSPRWSAYYLWENGRRIDAHCERCPHTAELVESLPLARIPDFAPNVCFACLEPRTVVPPHCGATNTRVIVQLPLLASPGSSLRVGHEGREYVYGRALAFNESIEHEARNLLGQRQAVLCLDTWHPGLSPAEQELVAGLISARQDYYRAEN